MYLQEIGWESVDWIGVAQDWNKWWVVVNKVLNIWVVLNAGDFFEQLRHYYISKMDPSMWSFCQLVSQLASAGGKYIVEFFYEYE